MKHYFMKLVLTIVFSFFAFTPSTISAKTLLSGAKSRLWVRLIGVVGLVWVALGLIANGNVSFIELTQAGKSAAIILRNTCGGIIIGLLIALTTKKFESG